MYTADPIVMHIIIKAVWWMVIAYYVLNMYQSEYIADYKFRMLVRQIGWKS